MAPDSIYSAGGKVEGTVREKFSKKGESSSPTVKLKFSPDAMQKQIDSTSHTPPSVNISPHSGVNSKKTDPSRRSSAPELTKRSHLDSGTTGASANVTRRSTQDTTARIPSTQSADKRNSNAASSIPDSSSNSVKNLELPKQRVSLKDTSLPFLPEYSWNLKNVKNTGTPSRARKSVTSEARSYDPHGADFVRPSPDTPRKGSNISSGSSQSSHLQSARRSTLGATAGATRPSRSGRDLWSGDPQVMRDQILRILQMDCNFEPSMQRKLQELDQISKLENYLLESYREARNERTGVDKGEDEDIEQGNGNKEGSPRHTSSNKAATYRISRKAADGDGDKSRYPVYRKIPLSLGDIKKSIDDLKSTYLGYYSQLYALDEIPIKQRIQILRGENYPSSTYDTGMLIDKHVGNYVKHEASHLSAMDPGKAAEQDRGMSASPGAASKSTHKEGNFGAAKKAGKKLAVAKK